MYNTSNMPNLINVTQARNNFSSLLDNITNKQESYIVIRDSVPQAVVIPYKQYLQQEQNWADAFDKTSKELKIQFRKELIKQKTSYPKTEEEMYELVNKATGRN